MPYHFYDSEVIDIIDVNPLVKRFFFRIPEVEKFSFGAGQFVMLDLPIQSKITTRSYSIASAPEGTNVIELLISLNEQGLGTPYLFSQIKKGSRVPLSQPAGKFMQPSVSNIETDICMICTGTGIAPFRAYLKDIVNRNVQHKNIDLIFGSRFEKDLLYREEMESLAKTIPGFRYSAVLSREQSQSWQGEKGYVHTIYEKLYANKPPAMFYLCGWKVMVKEARDRIINMGYDKKQVKFELYD
ncbi:MAG TPA: FAD-binding oxidoreductase [Bacteroidia bacterium]|jgi:ferredoxin-NADP reductase|nr:FAD-binding oxidoreductase [Bacteroidia bacterium]